MNIDDLLEQLSESCERLESFCDVILLVATKDSELYNFAEYIKEEAESRAVILSNLACAIGDND